MIAMSLMMYDTYKYSQAVVQSSESQHSNQHHDGKKPMQGVEITDISEQQQQEYDF